MQVYNTQHEKVIFIPFKNTATNKKKTKLRCKKKTITPTSSLPKTLKHIFRRTHVQTYTCKQNT